MAIIDILKQIDFENLNDEQKTALAKLLQKHRRDLRTALDAVETGLQQLAPEPAPKRPRSASARGTRRK